MSPLETGLMGYCQAHMSIPAKGLALSQSCERVDTLVEAGRGQGSMRIIKLGPQGHLVLGKMMLIGKDQVRQELAHLNLAQ
jgi:hypothetical protein